MQEKCDYHAETQKILQVENWMLKINVAVLQSSELHLACEIESLNKQLSNAFEVWEVKSQESAEVAKDVDTIGQDQNSWNIFEGLKLQPEMT